MGTRPLTINLEDAAVDKLLPFNFRLVDDVYFVSNELGWWSIMGSDDFSSMITGTLEPGGERHSELVGKGFVAGGIEPYSYRESYWRRREALFTGPALHELVLTGRTRFSCAYARPAAEDAPDMGRETAELCIDFAFHSASDALTFRFTGGEPLLNWKVLTHAVEYAQEQNKVHGKHLSFSVETELSAMTAKRLEFLSSIGAQICTTLDGPKDLHDGHRSGGKGSPWTKATGWIEKINAAAAAAGDEPTASVDAQVVVTGRTLGRAKEIVDTYLALGCRSITFRPLEPFSTPADMDADLQCDAGAFVEFYAEALGHVLAANTEEVALKEEFAGVLLAKMHARRDPNFLDLRSPAGSAIGQLSYDTGGAIYSSPEGRAIADAGDEFFLLGNVAETSYGALIDSPQVRALVLAGTNDGSPGCVSCAYKPYCGTQPEFSYLTQGSIQGRMLESDWCKRHMGVFDHLVRRRREATEEDKALMMAWVAGEAIVSSTPAGGDLTHDD